MDQPPDHQTVKAYKRCDDWSIERIERWADSAIQSLEFEAAAGYLLALTLQLGLARESELLRRIVDNRLPSTFEKLAREDMKVVQQILIQVINNLATRPDFDVADEDLDLVTAAAVKLTDSSADYEDPITISLLHTIGNVYQSQLRYSELKEIRKRQLQAFKPTNDQFKAENESLFALWQSLADEGRLDDAQICFNDLCEQIGGLPNLGNEALCELLLNMTSISFSENKPERVDLIVDAALAVAQNPNLGAETAQSASRMLVGMSAQLEHHEWLQEAIRLSKQAVILLLDKSPSANELTGMLRKTITLIKKEPKQSSPRSYFKTLQELSAGKAIPATFKTILNEQITQSDEAQKLLDDFQAKITNANEQDPEKRARELTQAVNQSLQKVEISHLKPILKELASMYRQSPLSSEHQSVAHHVWNLAYNFSSTKPLECAPFIEELTTIAVERIRKGELLKPYITPLSNIQQFARARKIPIMFQPIFSALLESEIPDNRLDGLQMQVRGLNPSDVTTASKLFESVIEIAPEASRAKEADECYAIDIFLELARHMRNPRSAEGDTDKTELLQSKALDYFRLCVNDNHLRLAARHLWRFAENGGLAGHRQTDFAVQLIAVCENKLLETTEVAEVDRCLLSCVNQITRTDRAEAEKLLVAAIEIRESSKGAKSESLLPLLRHRLPQLEFAKRISDCEDIQRRIDEIKSDKPLSEDQIHAEQIEKANFYVRNDLFDQAEKLWKPILEKCLSGGPSRSHLGTMRRFIHLSDSYLRKERYKESEDILVRAIPMLDEGGYTNLTQIFDRLLKKFEELGQVDSMERLYLAHINAPNRPIAAANQFRLILSELYLSAGRPVESRVMFEEAIKVARLQRLDTRTLLHARAASLIRHGFSEEVAELQPQLVHSNKPPCFEFALFGVQEVSLSHNAEVGSYKSSLNVSPGRGRQSASGHVGSYGSVRLEHNGHVFGSVVQPPSPTDPRHHARAQAQHLQKRMEMINRARGVNNENCLPAPVLADYKFAPVPPIPDSAVTIETHRGQMPNLTAGDYAMSESRGAWLRPQNSGRIRVFLIDDASSGATPFGLGELHQANGKPIDLQFWYAGTREIVVGSLCATIYAPNATVRLSGNATFFGAILANRIICDGNACVCFDEDLAGKEL